MRGAIPTNFCNRAKTALLYFVTDLRKGRMHITCVSSSIPPKQSSIAIIHKIKFNEFVSEFVFYQNTTIGDRNM